MGQSKLTLSTFYDSRLHHADDHTGEDVDDPLETYPFHKLVKGALGNREDHNAPNPPFQVKTQLFRVEVEKAHKAEDAPHLLQAHEKQIREDDARKVPFSTIPLIPLRVDYDIHEGVVPHKDKPSGKRFLRDGFRLLLQPHLYPQSAYLSLRTARVSPFFRCNTP